MRASQIRVSLFLKVYRIEYRTIRSPLQGCLRPATESPHALRGAALDRSVGAAFFLVTELPHALCGSELGGSVGGCFLLVTELPHALRELSWISPSGFISGCF